MDITDKALIIEKLEIGWAMIFPHLPKNKDTILVSDAQLWLIANHFGEAIQDFVDSKTQG